MIITASNVAAEFDIKIQSMENCSTSQRTFYIQECTFSECCLNFTGNVLRPLHKIQVIDAFNCPILSIAINFDH